jgi:hypothetical protein
MEFTKDNFSNSAEFMSAVRLLEEALVAPNSKKADLYSQAGTIAYNLGYGKYDRQGFEKGFDETLLKDYALLLKAAWLRFLDDSDSTTPAVKKIDITVVKSAWEIVRQDYLALLGGGETALLASVEAMDKALGLGDSLDWGLFGTSSDLTTPDGTVANITELAMESGEGLAFFYAKIEEFKKAGYEIELVFRSNSKGVSLLHKAIFRK